MTYLYDLNGNRGQMTDGTGTTSYSYDELNRLISVVSPGPTTVGYRYDLDGNRRKLIYPDGTAVTYTFNKGSQLASLSDWAGRVTAYTYFPDGALEDTANPNGTIATYAYDNARRLSGIVHAQGAGPILDLAYTLDGVGNVTTITDAGSPASTYGDDRLYRLTSATEPIVGSTTYAYDPVGSRESRIRSTTTTYAYDRADRILSLEGPPTPRSSTRPPSSHNSGWTNSANGYSTDDIYATTAPKKNKTKTVEYGTFGFDATIPANATVTNVTVSVEWKVSTSASIATLGARAYVNGTPVGTELVTTGEPTTDTIQTFSVPGLTPAQLLDGTFTVHVRATRGNTNTAFSASLDAVSVTVDSTLPGTVTVTSDANGNLLTRDADTFTYDGANRLISATVAGVSETYAYDGDGVRFSRTVGAGPAIRSVSDINTGLPVTLDDGTRKYVWGQRLAYAVSGTSIEVYHADRLGSIRAITDATGAVTATYRTDEYGIPTASTGSSTQPFTFTGEPRDASGLSYLRARYYDPTLGRFLSRDGWAGAFMLPFTLTRYPYAGQNPSTYRDPSGLWTVGVCVTVSVSVFGFGGQLDACVVASSNLQVALTGTGGAGGAVGAVPISGSAGLVAQVSNADYVEDLAGPFTTSGALPEQVSGDRVRSSVARADAVSSSAAPLSVSS